MKKHFSLSLITLLLPAVTWGQPTDSLETRLSKLEKMLEKLPDISGYINMRYQYNSADGGSNSFDIRRVRLSLQGNINPQIDYKLQAEFAYTPKILDAFVQWKPLNALNIKAGQYKLPFSIENPYSPLKLETADYSQAVNELIPYSNGAGGRDIGVSLWGGFLKKEGYNLIDYNVGVFNGSGINNLDNNKKKSFVGTLSIHPVKELTIAGSYYFGGITKNSLTEDAYRFSGGIRYENDRWLFRSEYIGGKTGRVRSGGYYAIAGFRFIPKLQGVLKYDSYQHDIHDKDTRSTHYIVGLNYSVIRYLQLHVNYAYRENRMAGNSNYIALQLFAAF